MSASFAITIDQNQLKLTSNNTPSNPINSFTKLCTNDISQTINVMIIVCSAHVKQKNGSLFGGETKIEQQTIGRTYNAFHESNLGIASK